ncbi:MAG: leucyl aminopeptidase [Anaerolineae bacterium]|nr:leucyl aminopeptidase [Anaerolineae bacterium]
MQFSLIFQAPHLAQADALILSMYEDEALHKSPAAADAALGGAIADLLSTGDFTGKASQVAVLYPRGALPARRLILVGLGKRESLTLDTLRRAAAVGVQKARELKAKSLASTLHGRGSALSAESCAQAYLEGAVLGNYQYHGQKSSAPSPELPETLTLVLPEDAQGDKEAVERGMNIGQVLGEATCLARTLVNLPPNLCTPQHLAETARQIAQQHGLSVQVLDRAEMEALKMGALLGVARGSAIPPQFIILEHQPERATEGKTIVLIGKGITFDTGGYSIKPADSMVAMKNDMAGAAAVLGAMQAIAELKVPRHVVGLVPATFNMISGEAYLPSEVLTASNGKTIEVISTDAEGRLILADALVYAARYKPAAVVDIATLTGSIVVALGNAAAGLFTTNNELREALLAAAEATGERLWTMPMYSDYEKLIESKTADIKNSGGRHGGACIGAVFLKHFADYPAWAHIDMAGMADDLPNNPIYPSGASGYGVRLLTEYVRRAAQ